MKTADRQKMCSHCDGRIPLEAITCPYCNAEQVNKSSNASSGSSLYSPPYVGKGLRYSIGDEQKEEPAFRQQEMFQKEEKEEDEEEQRSPSKPSLSLPPVEKAMSADTPKDESSQFWPLFMLSLGSILATLGLLQFFFSDNGFLRLEWDSSYWFLYCLISLPLFFFGIKKVNQIKS